MNSLDPIFYPGSVAVVGASNNEKKWGYRLLRNIMDGGFRGGIYPVNPGEAHVQGLPGVPSVKELEGKVELAVIAVPSQHVLAVVDECGRSGVKGLVVVSAGFAETGGKGKELEQELVSLVRDYGMRMIGPNTLGIVNERASLNASIIGRLPRQGGISFITQSGTLGLALADWAIDMGLGLSKIISTGNKADTDDVDLLEYLDRDESTQVVVMYMEGVKRGRLLLESVKRIKKPIVAIKTGRSQQGARAVFSHTGSMAGSDEVFSAAFRQCGIIRVGTVECIFDAALALSTQPLPAGNSVAIISNGGGASIVATDECEKRGLVMAELSETTRDRIRQTIPAFASASNPVDTAGTSTVEVYRIVTEALLQDPGVDSIAALYVHTLLSDALEPAKALAELKSKYPKPIVACWMGGAGTEAGVELLKKSGVADYVTPERAIKALAALVMHREFKEKVKT
ncbi:MAG TPA: acetyl-CoA synthetase [Candidatus Methanoperedenaceae archaeon]|nr:acetyl-CoA synthetase [Candidatus Methanoperedenaceae archaeon]